MMIEFENGEEDVLEGQPYVVGFQGTLQQSETLVEDGVEEDLPCVQLDALVVPLGYRVIFLFEILKILFRSPIHFPIPQHSEFYKFLHRLPSAVDGDEQRVERGPGPVDLELICVGNGRKGGQMAQVVELPSH